MKLLKNITYDIQAIKKYGLFTHFKYLFDYNHVIVILQAHTDFVPPFEPNSLFEIKEVDFTDAVVLQEWADIVNEAFGFANPYDVNSAKSNLTEHSYRKIENLYFVYYKDDPNPAGTIFIGTSRNNSKLGIFGRIAVRKKFQKHGLGKYLVLWGFEKFREKGIKLTEDVAYFKRDYTLRLWIRCGAIPQFNRNYMNFKPTPKFFLTRLWVQKEVKKIYADFLISLRKPYIFPVNK